MKSISAAIIVLAAALCLVAGYSMQGDFRHPLVITGWSVGAVAVLASILSFTYRNRPPAP